eukprot:m51a1_g2224 putative adenylyl cyclase-associated (502) ;mRNA; f:230653-232531
MDSAIASLTQRIETLSNRLQSVETKLAQGPPASAPCASGAAASAPAAAVGAGEVSAAQREFDELVDTHVRPLVALCDTFSAPILKEQLGVFLEACAEESRLIGTAARSRKPSADQLPKALERLSAIMGRVAEFKDKNGRAKEFNNIAAVAEGVAALGWVAVEPTPAPFMNDIIPGSEFYSNRVLTANKGKDENQVKWAKEFNSFLRNLQAYVKRSHTTGLSYSANGGDFLANLQSGAGAAPAAAAGGCPPPPPPPPAGLLADMPPAGGAPSKPSVNPSAVFAELNKGTDISKGLKHVSADQKTKNRSAEDRAAGGLKPKEPAAPAARKTEAKQEKVRPPVKTLNGNKWNIENQVNAQITIAESEIERNHAFYIGNCKGCTIQIKGKINSITIDNCNKTGLVVDSVVAVIEIVNSNSCQLQVVNKSPSVNIDKCNSCQIYLSPEACGADPTNVYTTKCSSVNIVIPGATPDADIVEMPVPEQFISVVRGGKLVTEIASSHGF